MSELRKHIVGMMDGSRHSMQQFALDLDTALDNIRASIPSYGKKFQDDPNNPPTQQSVPNPATFSVTPLDGKFKIVVTNPQNVQPLSPTLLISYAAKALDTSGAVILHQIQSATDTAFNNASGITDYGVSAALSYTFQDPNVIKFWRLRSSFDGKNWNSWQIFIDPAQCGPVGVASGNLRSEAAALAMSFNQTNFATVDSIDSGADATIRVYGTGGVGSSWTRPANQGTRAAAAGPYPAATLLHFSYDTVYYVAWDTVNLAYIVSTTLPATLPDAIIPVGALHTLAPGVAQTATAISVLTPTSVASIAVNNGGSGYAGAPTVVISGGGGSGATATAVLNGMIVDHVVVNNGGSGYTSQPTIQFSGGGGSGAVGTSTLTATSVSGVQITNGGSGYTSPPTVSFAGGGGNNAAGTAKVANGQVSSVSITNGGSGYTSPPTVSFANGSSGIVGGGGGGGGNGGRLMGPAVT